MIILKEKFKFSCFIDFFPPAGQTFWSGFEAPALIKAQAPAWLMLNDT